MLKFRKFFRGDRDVVRYLVIGMVLAQVWATRFAEAEPVNPDWQVKPEFHLTGISNFTRHGGKSFGHDTFAATAELTLYTEGRPYWGGPFIDYRTSSSDQFRDNLNLGVYFRYNFPRWDHTAWLFENRSPGNDGTMVYATRSRYRLNDRHKIGVEALAPLDDAGKPELMLGYYGAVGDALSLKMLAGAGSSGAPDFAAKLEVTWHVL
jgi:hypothetical protein